MLNIKLTLSDEDKYRIFNSLKIIFTELDLRISLEKLHTSRYREYPIGYLSISFSVEPITIKDQDNIKVIKWIDVNNKYFLLGKYPVWVDMLNVYAIPKINVSFLEKHYYYVKDGVL